MPFTDEERDRIVGMIQAGLSRRQIADVFHMGRNAFIGRIFRDKKLKAIAPPPPKPRERRTSVPSTPPRLKIVPSPPPAPRNDPPPSPPENMRRVPLMDLNRNECNWPIEMDRTAPGGHLFCGAKTPRDQNWCPYHSYVGHTSRVKAGAR